MDDSAPLNVEQKDSEAADLPESPQSEEIPPMVAAIAELIEPDWYLSQCDDATRAALVEGGDVLEVVRHYLEVGSEAQLSPARAFSSVFYRSRYGDLLTGGQDPLVHYLKQGAADGLSPHPLLQGGAPVAISDDMYKYASALFDGSAYLGRNPDVQTVGLDPLHHFFEWGLRENRSPHELFDIPYYLAQTGEKASVDPFATYIANGKRVRSHPRIDVIELASQLENWEQSKLSPIEFLETAASGWHHLIVNDKAATPDVKTMTIQEFFDKEFYLSQISDKVEKSRLKTLGNCISHYTSVGYKDGLKPNLLFSPNFYLRSNPDIAAAGVEPLGHWLNFGRYEGRSPHPLILPGESKKGKPVELLNPRDPSPQLVHPMFDGEHYVKAAGKTAIKGSPLLHYLRAGAKQGLSPHPYFDPEFYLSQLTAPLRSTTPLEHYVDTGAAIGLSPTLWFFPPHYSDTAGGAWVVSPDKALPQFLRSKRRAGTSPHPLFATEYYIKKAKLPVNTNDREAFEHFMRSGPAAVAFHPLFDIAFYSQQRLPDQWGGENPLIDYLKTGWRKGASPHPLFDPEHYSETAAVKDQNPFLHYLTTGNREGIEPNYLLRDVNNTDIAVVLQLWLDERLPSIRSPYSRFEREFYLKQLSDNKIEMEPGEDPLAHYLRKGFKLGLSPSRLFIPSFYRSKSGIGEDVDPFKHYLTEGGFKKYSPHPAIDLDYYESQTRDFDRDDEPVIDHFLRMPIGPRPLTHPFLDPGFYTTAHPDIAASGVCPVTHFLEYGIYEDRLPNALFSYQYSSERPDHGPVVLQNGVMRQFLAAADKPLRIIFVSHDSTRTGAPAIILRLLEDFSRFTKVECISILARGGERTGEFFLASHTSVLNRSAWEVGYRGELARGDIDKVLSLFQDNPPVAALVNSAESRHLGHLLKESGVPVISLVHELADFYPPPEFEWIYELSDLVVYPSHFVEKRAEAAVGLPEGKTVVRGQGLLRDGFGLRNRAAMRDKVLKEFGLSPDCVIAIGCGTIDQRKGVDYFVNIAKTVLKEQQPGNHPMVFLWIGDGHRNSTSPFYMAQMEIKAAGLERQIRFIGGREDVEPYFVGADIFLMTSRGDPYPCVIHEAMASGLPVIAFEGGGGAPELIADSGVIVPLGDIAAASTAVMELRDDAERRARLAARARQIIREKGSSHAYFEFFVEKIMEVSGRERSEFGDWRGYKPDGLPPIFFFQVDWSISGVNTFTEMLINHLRSAGYPVELLFAFGMGHLIFDRHTLPEGIPVRFLRPREHDQPSLWQRVQDFLMTVGPCVLIPNFDYRASAVTPTLSERVGVIGIGHSDHIEHYEHIYRLGRYWNKVVAVSTKIAEGVAEVNPALTDRLSVIPYGVKWKATDLRRLQKAKKGGSDVIRLAYAGRFVIEQKNIYEYIALADELHERKVPFEMCLCGDGPEYNSFLLKAANHIAAGRIVAPGRLDAAEMAEVYDRSDVLLLLSDYEGLPVAMLESMAHACVPVCYKIDSGIDEVLKDGENGFVVPSRDVKSAASAIESAWRDPELRKSMSKKAFESIGELHLRQEDMGEKYRELVDQVYSEIRDLTFKRPKSLTSETPFKGIIPSPLFR